MRLLLDMGVAPRTAIYLRALQHDVDHLRDRGLQQLPDPDIVALAQRESRTIVTFDLDFTRILALRNLASPSIVLFRLERFTTDQVNSLLQTLLVKYESDLLSGAVVVVDPRRIRMRRLPII